MKDPEAWFTDEYDMGILGQRMSIIEFSANDVIVFIRKYLISHSLIFLKNENKDNAQADEDYRLWEFFKDEHELILTDGQLTDILFEIEKYQQSKNNFTCKLIKCKDDFTEFDITECCGIGPITSENYCPNCGKEILKDLAK